MWPTFSIKSRTKHDDVSLIPVSGAGVGTTVVSFSIWNDKNSKSTYID